MTATKFIPFYVLLLLGGPAWSQSAPGPKRILIGVEYCYPGGGKTFGQLGVPATKPYGEMHNWGVMQKSKNAAIDFKKLDGLVKEYQDAGFTEIYLSLKANNPWGSRSRFKNTVPKPEYWHLYEKWVQAIAQRYDADGQNDMPGLRRPLRYFEIGAEFSSFQPEPTADYLEMLEHAYKAIKAANPQAVVLHAAFLVTTAFKDHPQAADYPRAFAAVDRRIMDKSLADIRAVLDRPDIFDAVNFHALGDPLEIEDTVAWLRWEMAQRRYTRPIIISDTTPTPFIAWGNAIIPKGQRKVGVVIPPATEKDRPRLNRFFQKLLDQDRETLSWTHAFVGADMIKKTLIATDMGVGMINTSFMEDLTLFQTKFFAAGAGTSAWAGMAQTKINIFKNEQRTILGLRPHFYAVGQLQKHLGDYTDLQRIKMKNSEVRLYSWKRGRQRVWAGWLEPKKLFLPEDPVPKAPVVLASGAGSFVLERMIDRPGQTQPDTETLSARGGKIELKLTPRPVFVRGKAD